MSNESLCIRPLVFSDAKQLEEMLSLGKKTSVLFEETFSLNNRYWQLVLSHPVAIYRYILFVTHEIHDSFSMDKNGTVAFDCFYSEIKTIKDD